MAMKALRKHGTRVLVTHCFNGEIRFWKIGFNAHNNLELALTIHDEPFTDRKPTESVEELLQSDRTPRDTDVTWLAVAKYDQ